MFLSLKTAKRPSTIDQERLAARGHNEYRIPLAHIQHTYFQFSLGPFRLEGKDCNCQCECDPRKGRCPGKSPLSRMFEPHLSREHNANHKEQCDQPERRPWNPVAPPREMSEPVNQVHQQHGGPHQRSGEKLPSGGEDQTHCQCHETEWHQDPDHGHSPKVDNRSGQGDAMKIARHQGQHPDLQRHGHHQQLPDSKRQRQSTNKSVTRRFAKSLRHVRRDPLSQQAQIDPELRRAWLVGRISSDIPPASQRSHIGLRGSFQPRHGQPCNGPNRHERELKA